MSPAGFGERWRARRPASYRPGSPLAGLVLGLLWIGLGVARVATHREDWYGWLMIVFGAASFISVAVDRLGANQRLSAPPSDAFTCLAAMKVPWRRLSSNVAPGHLKLDGEEVAWAPDDSAKRRDDAPAFVRRWPDISHVAVESFVLSETTVELSDAHGHRWTFLTHNGAELSRAIDYFRARWQKPVL